ncbi:MAG: hypothetical protein OSJ83_03760 [Clostridia bacterium]|nr:hypothetical protein [Clostridia bacterium]
MKKFCAAVIVFAAVLVAVAVWFSPLSSQGSAYVYENNVPVRAVTGCYGESDVVRTDFDGGEKDLENALRRMLATVVKKEQAGGRTVIYAYSPRVAADLQTTCDGLRYNVMAAYENGHVVIGAPVIQGSY